MHEYRIFPVSNEVGLEAVMVLSGDKSAFRSVASRFLDRLAAEVSEGRDFYVEKEIEPDEELLSILIAQKAYPQKERQLTAEINEELKRGRKNNLNWFDRVFETKKWEEHVARELEMIHNINQGLNADVYLYAEFDADIDNRIEIFTSLFTETQFGMLIEEVGRKISQPITLNKHLQRHA